MRRRLSVAVLLTFLLVGLGSALLLTPTVCPDLPLGKLLLAPADLSSKLEGAGSWKVSVPEYQTVQKHGFAPEENLGRAWTEGGEVTASPQLTQHVAKYTSSLRAWIQEQLLRRSSSRPGLTLHQLFPRRADQEQLPPSAYVECEQGDEDACQVPVYRSRHGQYLLRIQLMGGDGSVPLEFFGDAILIIERDMSAHLSGCP